MFRKDEAVIRGVLAVTSFALATLFALAYYGQYFKWRGCFNELGRCFDPETGVVYMEQAGLAWGIMAVSALAFALYHSWKLWKARQNPKD